MQPIRLARKPTGLLNKTEEVDHTVIWPQCAKWPQIYRKLLACLRALNAKSLSLPSPGDTDQRPLYRYVAFAPLSPLSFLRALALLAAFFASYASALLVYSCGRPRLAGAETVGTSDAEALPFTRHSANCFDRQNGDASRHCFHRITVLRGWCAPVLLT